MSWSERKLTPRFGMELSGQQLNDPELPQAERDAVLDAVCTHGVVVVSGQDLGDEQMLDFAGTLGVVMEGPGYASDGRVPKGHKIFRLTNLDDDGKFHVAIPGSVFWTFVAAPALGALAVLPMFFVSCVILF